MTDSDILLLPNVVNVIAGKEFLGTIMLSNVVPFTPRQTVSFTACPAGSHEERAFAALTEALEWLRGGHTADAQFAPQVEHVIVNGELLGIIVLHAAALNRPYARVRWEARELANPPQPPLREFASRMCDSHADALAFVLRCARPTLPEDQS